MVAVTLVVEVLMMDLDDLAAHVPGFRIPAHMVADRIFRHDGLQSRRTTHFLQNRSGTVDCWGGFGAMQNEATLSRSRL
jgi:hypothetical protein